MTATELVKYEAARRALSECIRIDEAKHWRDKAKAMECYAKQRRDPDLIQTSIAIRRRAVRRIGELMEEERKAGKLAKGARGNPKGRGAKIVRITDDPTQTLAERGIDKHLATEARSAAATPERQYEAETAKTIAGALAALDVAQKTAEAAARREARAAERKAVMNGKHVLPPEIQILQGDCREVLKQLADGSAHACVTSPPYFNMRDYQATNQIGTEETLEEYIRNLVEVFRGVRRVLREDGTLWIVIGDCYAGSGKGAGIRSVRNGGGLVSISERTTTPRVPTECKAKDLMGVPWELALALRADGWWLRSANIWDKTTAAPESVRDRCTASHEYILMLAKSEKYYFDSDAIAEPSICINDKRFGKGRIAKGNNKIETSSHDFVTINPTKNKRSVWRVATSRSDELHSAIYPEALIEPCILAGCPEGGVVLDPFAGSGTTAIAAKRLGRSAVLVEVNPEYVTAAKARVCAEKKTPRQTKRLPIQKTTV
jgi:DNA modification methylase